MADSLPVNTNRLELKCNMIPIGEWRFIQDLIKPIHYKVVPEREQAVPMINHRPAKEQSKHLVIVLNTSAHNSQVMDISSMIRQRLI